jgi:hypothetical protein
MFAGIPTALHWQFEDYSGSGNPADFRGDGQYSVASITVVIERSDSVMT